MNLPGLSWRYLWSRPLGSALNLLLLTLGLTIVAFVLLAQDRLARAFERDLQGIDLVVGAKGSPLQLILAGVFHLDVPPGNVALGDVQALARHPQVAQVIPLSLGDSLLTFRIVGTSPDYVTLYGAALSQGSLWTGSMQAVLGAQVARATRLSVGQTFAGAHGLGGGGHLHEDTAYTVAGVLRPCGCVLDRLVLTDTASVWAVHEGLAPGEFESLPAGDRAAIEAERDVTLALVRYRTPLAAVSLPRLVNTTTKMQAAAPAVEITRLLSLLGVGAWVFQGVGAVLLVVAGLSVFIALWSAVRERRADIAMLRMLGAPPGRVGALLLLESLWLALLACSLALLLALGLGRMAGSLWQTGQGLIVDPWHWPSVLWSVPALSLGVALVAAALPAFSAYRVDVASLLSSSNPSNR
ncbi:MAG: FtsX-like permease family protein [Burkholderiaceae bacterium]